MSQAYLSCLRHVVELVQDLCEAVYALRTTYQMALVKHHSWHALNTLLHPKLLGGSDFASKALVGQHSGCLRLV